MSKIFVDTNVLVYACDRDAGAKRTIARRLLTQAEADHTLCLSTQVLQEFYVVATRKLGADPLKAKAIVESFQYFETVTIDPDDIHRAIDGNILWQTSFRDALILVAAQKARCGVLYSEDLRPGRTIGSVRVVNPFSKPFSGGA